MSRTNLNISASIPTSLDGPDIAWLEFQGAIYWSDPLRKLPTYTEKEIIFWAVYMVNISTSVIWKILTA
jgi:hypothetical protein